MLKVLVLVALVAGLLYLAFWALEQRRAGIKPSFRRRTQRKPPPRVIGPDDDDDFLRGL